MLTKNDLKRKQFNLSELNKIPSLVFTPNTSIQLPPNLDTLLFLLRKIQLKNLVEKLNIEKQLNDLENQAESEELNQLKSELGEQLTHVQYSRHRLHTIYSQILIHLFNTKQLELLYVQSHETQVDVKNVVTAMYGGHVHRVQIKAAHLKEYNLEDRGVRYKKDVEQFDENDLITDDQLAEYGYTVIEVIRLCRRLSNYLSIRIASIKTKNAKINEHNILAGKIKLMAKANEVTIINETKANQPERRKASTPTVKPKQNPNPVQTKDKTIAQRSSASPKSSTRIADHSSKKPINVIRKRTFVLNK